MKSPPTLLNAALPHSRGAAVVSPVELQVALAQAMLKARESSSLGSFLLVKVLDERGEGLQGDDLRQASFVMSQFVRQSDSLAVLDAGLLGIVCQKLENRADLHVLMERMESFVVVSKIPWSIKAGAAVFPLSGASPTAIFDAAHRDLEGAISSDNWEHSIPRETLAIRPAS